MVRTMCSIRIGFGFYDTHTRNLATTGTVKNFVNNQRMTRASRIISFVDLDNSSNILSHHFIST